MGNNSHKPAIRFQGFTDAWEQRKLGDIADTKTGPFGTQLSAKEYTTSGIPVINVKNIGSGCIQENDLDYVSEGTAKRLNDHIIRENDIVFGRKGAIGRHAIIGKTQNNWVQGSDCIRVRFKPGIVASYVNAQLQTTNVIDYLSMNAYGSTMLTLTTDMINSIPLLMPEEAEQAEIAHVFSDIDNLITLHQRKYQKLITVKKSMLEKMFPRDGSNNPEIRFIGFTDPWEQRKLGAAVNSIDTGKSKFDKEGSSGNYAILGSTSVIGYDTEYDYEGDFILTARVGANAGSLYRHTGKVKISDNTVFIQASENIEFLYHLLTQFNIKKLSFGTGQPLVKTSELKNLELMMPTDTKEQIKIGDCFKALDNLITLHQRKLEKLKNIKQSLLQNMFV